MMLNSAGDNFVGISRVNKILSLFPFSEFLIICRLQCRRFVIDKCKEGGETVGNTATHARARNKPTKASK